MKRTALIICISILLLYGLVSASGILTVPAQIVRAYITNTVDIIVTNTVDMYLRDITTGAAAAIDASTNSLQVIDYEHHEMHAGKHFFGKQSASVTGGGTVAYFMFITPDTTTEIHAKAAFSASDEFRAQLYEGGTVSNNGIAVAVFNNDRNSENTPELAAYIGPTVTADGTLLWETYLTGDKGVSGVTSEFGYEIIAKRNTIYLFKITKINSGAHVIDTDFFWYEHTRKN